VCVLMVQAEVGSMDTGQLYAVEEKTGGQEPLPLPILVTRPISDIGFAKLKKNVMHSISYY